MPANKKTQEYGGLPVAGHGQFLLLILIASGALAACQHTKQAVSSLPGVGDKFSLSITPTGSLPPATARTWPDVQQDVLNQQARGFGLARMTELEAYLNGLLAKIKVAAGVPNWPGSVYVLATPTLEAYATAAGNIYISPSWVTSAESEDEIVALLSHEFGHVYLHYHQVAAVVEGTDQTAQIAAVGLAIVKNKMMGNVWTPVDSLLVGYIASRDLMVGDYGRSEEIDSDSFGLNVSLKLGYSYENGIKAFLERISTWEETNEKRRMIEREKLVAAIQQQARDATKKRAALGNQVDVALQTPFGEINAGIATFSHQLKTVVEDGIGFATAKHPDTATRIERQAVAAESLSPELASRDPVFGPLDAARQRPNTATALQNYQLASEVMQDITSPTALKKAQKAASGPTATHAMPLSALFKAQRASAVSLVRSPQQRIEPGNVHNRNFNSPPDRAWRAYVEHALYLQSRGDVAAANKTIDSGMSHFRNAPEAWPQAIQFYGQTKGWQVAKNMANECGKIYKAMADSCSAASVSPAEKAEADRVSKEKANKIADKMFKKWK